MHGFHSMPQVRVQQVSLKACRRWDSTCDKMMVISHINELSNLLDLGNIYSYRGGPLLWFHGKGIIFFGQFWKLAFYLIRECQIFADRGQIRIFIDRECVASIPT